MAERILLVTGSRALDHTDEARAWAREQIARAVEDYDPEAIVMGDAYGPDKIARAMAAERRRTAEVWTLGGNVLRYEAHYAHSYPWWPGGVPRLDPKKWPHARNAAMCASVGMRAAGGAVVSVLALTAPWTRTHGTGHTVSRAREAGLVVPPPLVCPAELGPGARS